jgi:hypothetical protein
MNFSNLFSRSVSLSLIAGVITFSSCKDEERLTATDTQDISEEALTDAYFQDIDDMGGVVMGSPTENAFSSGRSDGTITITDDRFKCAMVTIQATGTLEHPTGTITVDFGSGCIDNRMNVRKGKLKFSYSGWRFIPGSSVTLTTEAYAINDVKLEGTRTSTNVQGSTADAPKYNVVLTNGRITFPDGSSAERESDITWEWIRAANPVDDYLVIAQESTADGITRGGRDYHVSLAEPLKYKRFCGIAVDGIKNFTIDGEKEIVLDYGDGTCDKSVAITVNGVTRNVSVN